MRQHNFGGPLLPRELREQIGAPAPAPRKTIRGRPLQNRKDRRKAERRERGLRHVQQQQLPRRAIDRRKQESPESRDEEDEGISNDEVSSPEASPPPPKSILKKSAQSTRNREPSPSAPSPPPKISRAAREKLAQDDAEIAALEKRLGMRKKKPKASEDGLDGIFGDLGGFSSDEETRTSATPKRKRGEQDDEWLASKRRKALGKSAQEVEEGDSEVETSQDSDADEEFSEEDDDSKDGGLEDMVDQSSDFEDFGSSEEVSDEENLTAQQPRVRENPYVAPVTKDTQPTKYIPPALRAPPSSDTEALNRLRRQVQGLLNRLSDANLLTILRDVEQIYQNNPRGYVTTTLIDILIGLLADETALLETFLILHVGFIAAIYKVIGPDFGAQMVERIVSEFDKNYQRNKDGVGKQTTNLISVVAELYCFHVIGSNLVFDYIKLCLGELFEINTELLLRIVRVSGSQLRQDDPTSLKDIVVLLQKSVANVGKDNLSVRTKFMIETINNLKNNKMKTGVAASTVASEHTTRMRKQLGTLNSRKLKGSEPLRIGLADIKDTDKKGKWWLVGASWRRDTVEEAAPQKPSTNQENVHDANEAEDTDEVDLLQLSREYRMNTDVRRAIFVTIMSAVDYKDAHVRLLKLNLKKKQESTEIPRVIVRCAQCEKTYNPYYTLLAQKFSSDHKSRKCFQFVLWDIFKSLGENKDSADAPDDDGDESEEFDLRKLVILGKLYGTLMAKGTLSITTLKTLNFAYLQPKTKTLLEIMLVTTIVESQKKAKDDRDEKALLSIFINADAATEMVAGLQYFIKKTVSKTQILASKAEKETVKWACRSIVDMLTRLMAATTITADG